MIVLVTESNPKNPMSISFIESRKIFLLVSKPESRRDNEPKKENGFKKRFGVATIVILENYGKP